MLDDDPLTDPDDRGDIPASMIELEKIPRRLWEQTLAPLHRQQRMWVASQISDEQLCDVAMNLAFELDMAECRRRRARDEARFEARRSGVPLPTPDHDHAVTRTTLQINIRLRRDDHARLTQAALAVGLKRTTLARALVLNGVTKILQEHASPERAQTVHGRTPGYP
jgi:hypothetical protein